MLSKINDEILSYFPDKIKNKFNNVSENVWNKAKEIRIRVGQAILISCFNNEISLDYIISSEDIIRLLENFSDNSIYSIQNEINNGFITIKGGHRIGISGTSIFEENSIKNIKYISSMNIRIAREVKNCSIKIFNKIIKEKFENTIIISPPGCGKTTILRDMIRVLSNGFDFIQGSTVGLIDERSEIAAVYKGVPQNDIGIRTDVMNNCVKHIGMKMMVRSMGPSIIATDEIGSKEDIDAIYEVTCLGVKLLLTTHGNDILDIPETFLKNKLFKNIVVLENDSLPGRIKKIYNLECDKYVVIT